MKTKRYIKYVQCRGGCGKTLATGTRLGNAKTREKYAGYCDDCMTPEMKKQMQDDSLANMQVKVRKSGL